MESVNQSDESDTGASPAGAQAAAEVMARLSPPAEVRRVMETDCGFDPRQWVDLATVGCLGRQLGLGRHAAANSATHGAGGHQGGHLRDFRAAAALLEEAGAHLFCGPLLSTLVATAVLAECLDRIESPDRLERPGRLKSPDRGPSWDGISPRQECTGHQYAGQGPGGTGSLGPADIADLVGAMAAGERILGLAVAEDPGSWDPHAITTKALPCDPGWRIRGHKSYVIDGGIADSFLVAARSDGGVGLFLVDGHEGGLTHTALATVDLTRRQARLEFDDAPALLVPGARLDRLLDIAWVALAAESVGGARRCLELTVAHSRQRVQFGQPIGTFQAVSHRCAEMLVDLECAKAATDEAVASLFGPPLSAQLAPAAKVAATESFARAAASAIQIHGGTGFTWDCDVQLYYKRARASQLLLGSPEQLRETLASRLGWAAAVGVPGVGVPAVGVAAVAVPDVGRQGAHRLPPTDSGAGP
ncbi:MAG: acyl-CoA dehydrogenase family protein [Acidimicrobiales bacterium]